MLTFLKLCMGLYVLFHLNRCYVNYDFIYHQHETQSMIIFQLLQEIYSTKAFISLPADLLPPDLQPPSLILYRIKATWFLYKYKAARIKNGPVKPVTAVVIQDS